MSLLLVEGGRDVPGRSVTQTSRSVACNALRHPPRRVLGERFRGLRLRRGAKRLADGALGPIRESDVAERKDADELVGLDDGKAADLMLRHDVPRLGEFYVG